VNQVEAPSASRFTGRFLLFRIFFLFAALLWRCPNSAWAHAILVGSVPAADSTISEKEIDIELTFNSQVDGRRSRLLLFDGQNKEHTLTGMMQPKPQVLKVHVEGLNDGVYLVRWQVLAIDGHISRGQISFTIQRQDTILNPSARPAVEVNLVSRA
jgi:methionine-rich copper-binding protein CopC